MKASAAASAAAPDIGTSADAVIAAYLNAYQERVALLKCAPVGGSGVLAVVPLIMSRIGSFGFAEAHAVAFAREIGRLRGAHFLAVEDVSTTPSVTRVLREVFGEQNLPWYIGDLATLVSHAIAGINRSRF